MYHIGEGSPTPNQKARQKLRITELLERWQCTKSWPWTLKSGQVPSISIRNSIDLYYEGLRTKVDTSAHIHRLSSCIYKKVFRGVAHLWERRSGEEAQVSLGSLGKEIQGLVCPNHGLDVRKLGYGFGQTYFLGTLQKEWLKEARVEDPKAVLLKDWYTN